MDDVVNSVLTLPGMTAVVLILGLVVVLAAFPLFYRAAREGREMRFFPPWIGPRVSAADASTATRTPIDGQRLFQHKGLYPVDLTPGTNVPKLNSEIFVNALHHFLRKDFHDRLAAMDLVYLREDNREHFGDVLPPEAALLYQELIEKFQLREFQATYSEETRRLFRNIERIVHDLGDTLKGVYFEVLLHDVRNPLRSIRALRNTEEVSRRELFGPSTRFVVEYVKYQGKQLIEAFDKGHKIAYRKELWPQKPVKATTIPLYDDRYGLIGILCFNIDLGAVQALDSKGKSRFFEHYTETTGETPPFEQGDTSPE